MENRNFSSLLKEIHSRMTLREEEIDKSTRKMIRFSSLFNLFHEENVK